MLVLGLLFKFLFGYIFRRMKNYFLGDLYVYTVLHFLDCESPIYISNILNTYIKYSYTGLWIFLTNELTLVVSSYLNIEYSCYTTEVLTKNNQYHKLA